MSAEYEIEVRCPVLDRRAKMRAVNDFRGRMVMAVCHGCNCSHMIARTELESKGQPSTPPAAPALTQGTLWRSPQ